MKVGPSSFSAVSAYSQLQPTKQQQASEREATGVVRRNTAVPSNVGESSYRSLGSSNLSHHGAAAYAAEQQSADRQKVTTGELAGVDVFA